MYFQLTSYMISDLANYSTPTIDTILVTANSLGDITQSLDDVR